MGDLMTKYFIDAQGNYIGGFDGALPPAGAIEIQAPPAHGLDKWDGAEWIPYVPPTAPKPETVADLKAALIAKGVITQADVDAMK